MGYQPLSQKQPQHHDAAGGNPPPQDCSCLAIFVLAIAGCFFVYCMISMFFIPITPMFSVQSVDIPRFNISTSPPQIDTAWNITFSITNPTTNAKYYYKNAEVSVYYMNEFLSSTTMDPFHVEKSTEAHAVVINASWVKVQDGVAWALKGDLTREALAFSVMMDATVILDPGLWPFKTSWVTVICEQLFVGFLPYKINGTILGGSRECEVFLRFTEIP